MLACLDFLPLQSPKWVQPDPLGLFEDDDWLPERYLLLVEVSVEACCTKST
jgi:hypothetical protein